MLKLVLQRLVALVPLLLLVSVMTFALSHLLPADPVLLVLGEEATPEAYEEVERELGLDRPVPVQYVRWLGRAVQGDLGESLFNSTKVTQSVTERIPVTVSLTLAAVLIAVVVGVSAGIAGALRPGTWVDRLATFLATLGLALPNFWFGLLLVISLALGLGWFPATGYVALEESPTQWLRSITLPALALGTAASAALARQTRSSLAGVLQQPYIRTALAKGLSPLRVVAKHGLKNALIPVVTVLGFQVTTLLGGSLVVEQVFGLPGLGQLAIRAVLQQDVPMIQGVVLFTAVVVVVVSLAIDLAYGYLNPKVRVS